MAPKLESLTIDFERSCEYAILEAAQQIKEWTDRSIAFQIIWEQYKTDPAVNINFRFKFGFNQEIEALLIKLIAEGCWVQFGFTNMVLGEVHIRIFQIDYLYNSLLFSWFEEIEKAKTDQASYLDAVIREKLINPPGCGISYLFLSLVKRVKLTPILNQWIDDFETMQKEIYFGPEEKKGLLALTGKERKLRLAILLSHELGRLEKSNQLKTSIFDIRLIYWTLYHNSYEDYPILLETLLETNNDFVF